MQSFCAVFPPSHLQRKKKKSNQQKTPIKQTTTTTTNKTEKAKTVYIANVMAVLSNLFVDTSHQCKPGAFSLSYSSKSIYVPVRLNILVLEPIFLLFFFFIVFVIKFQCLKLLRQCLFYVLFILRNSKIHVDTCTPGFSDLPSKEAGDIILCYWVYKNKAGNFGGCYQFMTFVSFPTCRVSE